MVPSLTIAKLGYVAELLALVVLGLSKIIACVFYGTLFSHAEHRAHRIALAGMIVWMVLAILLLAIRCSHDPWNDISAAQCGSLVRGPDQILRTFGIENSSSFSFRNGQLLQRSISLPSSFSSCIPEWQFTKSKYDEQRN
jgi:hypothetical protein